MAKQKSLFAQITKVDVAKREVTGILMQEVVDKTKECCSYEKSKPYFEKWSANQAKASGGKSFGNVREMHSSSAAGIVKELTCDDDLKAFIITAKIVDDAAWAKVEEGVYTGYSVGANYAEKSWYEDGVKWWVADPVEASLVDVPCVPTALFTEIKADGTTAIRKFAAASQKQAEPGKKKSIYSIGQMGDILADLYWLASDLDWEAEWEGDASQIPQRLRDWMQSGVEIFTDLTEEESSEFAAAITAGKAARGTANKSASGSCGCACSNCISGDCPGCSAEAKCSGSKKSNQPNRENSMADVTKYATSDELKALTETLAAEKSAREATETKLAGIAETLKAIQEAQTQAAERDAEIAKFFEALGEEPTSSKTVHPAAAPVAVERAADTGNGGAGPVAIDTNKDYAKDAPASRAVLKSIYAEQK